MLQLPVHPILPTEGMKFFVVSNFVFSWVRFALDEQRVFCGWWWLWLAGWRVLRIQLCHNFRWFRVTFAHNARHTHAHEHNLTHESTHTRTKTPQHKHAARNFHVNRENGTRNAEYGKYNIIFHAWCVRAACCVLRSRVRSHYTHTRIRIIPRIYVLYMLAHL